MGAEQGLGFFEDADKVRVHTLEQGGHALPQHLHGRALQARTGQNEGKVHDKKSGPQAAESHRRIQALGKPDFQVAQEVVLFRHGRWAG